MCACVCVGDSVIFSSCKRRVKKQHNTHTVRQQIHANGEDLLSLPSEYIRLDFKVKMFDCVCFSYGIAVYARVCICIHMIVYII